MDTPFTSLPRFEARNAPPNGPDSAASIFVAAWWRRQQACPKVESGRTEPSTCWMAGCLHTTSNKQAGSSPVNDLAYRPNSPNAYDSPDKPVLLRLHGLPVCWQSAVSGLENGNKWLCLYCYYCVNSQTPRLILDLANMAHLSWTRLRLAEKRQKQEFSAALGVMQSGVQVQYRAPLAHTTLQHAHSSLITMPRSEATTVNNEINVNS